MIFCWVWLAGSLAFMLVPIVSSSSFVSLLRYFTATTSCHHHISDVPDMHNAEDPSVPTYCAINGRRWKAK